MTDIDRRSLLAGTAVAASMGAALVGTAAKAVQGTADLAGKSILITGCSSGFGRIGAVLYAQRGAKVFATMRNLPRPEADELRAQAAKEQLDIHIIEIDVTSDEQVAAGVAEAERINGGALDVLINNAGMSTAGPIEIQDMEATRLMFETNVFGPHRMMRAALPAMRAAKSGQIFNVTSQLGRVMLPGFGQYSPTKFALEAMSEQIAYELVQHNIDVTIIQPGGYPTKIWANANAMTEKLLGRADPVHLDGYTAMVEQLRAGGNTGGDTDPADVPRAIAEIIAMPAGTRPLRKEVHPGAKPQMAINKVCAEVQVGWLGASPYGPWVRAVHNA